MDYGQEHYRRTIGVAVVVGVTFMIVTGLEKTLLRVIMLGAYDTFGLGL